MQNKLEKQFEDKLHNLPDELKEKILGYVITAIPKYKLIKKVNLINFSSKISRFIFKMSWLINEIISDEPNHSDFFLKIYRYIEIFGNSIIDQNFNTHEIKGSKNYFSANDKKLFNERFTLKKSGLCKLNNNKTIKIFNGSLQNGGILGPVVNQIRINYQIGNRQNVQTNYQVNFHIHAICRINDTFIALTDKKNIYIMNILNGKILDTMTLFHGEQIFDIAASQDGKYLAASLHSGELLIFEKYII